MEREKELCRSIKKQFLKMNVKTPEESWPNDIQRALNCINENIFDYEFSINSMRKMCKIPQNNFSGRFKYFVNYTPVSYLKTKRIECAIEILNKVDSLLSISSLALEVGYKYASTFSTAFKNITGESPTRFMKN